ncbi:hypothetical protein JHK87_047943 [Glycine soja]|nr:hypothetical protein JHK87_047943 [Glycine soja]
MHHHAFYYFMSMLSVTPFRVVSVIASFNVRFVRWSDGSLQLLIGNEVLDISMQDAQHDQAHLFLRHDKVNFFILMDFLMNYCFPSMVYVYMLTGNPPITRKVIKENERKKVNQKYTPVVERRHQLSPGFLEDALDEDEANIMISIILSRIEDDLEAEARAHKS